MGDKDEVCTNKKTLIVPSCPVSFNTNKGSIIPNGTIDLMDSDNEQYNTLSTISNSTGHPPPINYLQLSSVADTGRKATDNQDDNDSELFTNFVFVFETPS